MEAEELTAMRGLALAALALATPAVAPAQKPAAALVADPVLSTRAAQLVSMLEGTGDYDAYFSAGFRASVSRAQFDAIASQLRAVLGKPVRIAASTLRTPRESGLIVAYERGTASVTLAVDGTAVSGLVVTATTTTNDTIEKLTADFRALPARSGFGIYALDADAPRAVAEWRGSEAAPLGSGFKLWILAETARQVKAGKRVWRDVVPLGPPSLPSGVTQTWVPATPMTLQSLVTLMISISDNTAADTLLHVLGREHVGRIAIASGASPASLPILSTREAFVLKGDPARAAAWTRADLPARRAMLADRARFDSVRLDPAMFGDTPLSSETVEWFASPVAMARLLGGLRNADATTRAILAIDPGTDPTTAARFAYVGFKGGSEPGVIASNFLVRTKDDRWFAVTGNWHRTDATIPTLTFLTLMNRALALVR